MKSLRFVSSIAILTVLLSFFSCTSTSLISSWRDPQTTLDKSKLRKILVFCLVKDETTRRVGEDHIVKRNPSVFVASYTVFTSGMDTSQIQKILNTGGYDGIMLMRLMSKEQQTSYVPGNSPTYYGGWHGYYGYSAPYYYDPGYYQTDDYYSVETNLYSLHPEKLIWSGITETMNPGSVTTTIDEIADAIAAQMKKEGFLVDSSAK